MGSTRIIKLLTVAVGIVTATVAAVLFGLQGQNNAAAQAPYVSVETPTVVPPTATRPPTARPATTTPPTTVAPPTTLAPPPVATPGTLRPGDTGPDVLALQQRLVGLGYWLGTPDATYGDLTVQAVTAFQKVQGIERDGIVGPSTGAALQAATRPIPASTGGDLIEVDKARQVLFVVRAGAVAWTLNTSTGTERPYQIDGRTELADTPPGHWKVTSAHDGVDVGELGALYRPRYFHPDGIAVHGYSDVPAYPASHGCVRVSNQAIDWIWADALMPLGSSVWVY